MIRRRLELAMAVPPSLQREVREKLPYSAESIVSFELSELGDAIDLALADSADGEVVMEKVRQLVESLVKGWRPVDKEILWSHRVAAPHRAAPWDELVARGLVQSEGAGQIALAGDAVRLLEALDRRFVAMANDCFGAEAHRYPTMLSMEAMDRCHYFASFPQHVTFAPHLREDVDSLRAVSAAPQHDEHAFLEHLRPPRHVLSPAICFHTYLGLADRQLDGPRTVTAVGRCFRYESSNFTTLERVWDFTLREIIFVGPKGWVEERRERALAETQRLVEELGLDGWIETASDPFFVNNFVAKRFFQLMTRTKYELQLGLPADGRSLAAASFNLHQDFFGKSFGIAIDGGFAATGCVGFGLERWVWALFCQLGPAIAAWPATVQRALAL